MTPSGARTGPQIHPKPMLRGREHPRVHSPRVQQPQAQEGLRWAHGHQQRDASDIWWHWDSWWLRPGDTHTSLLGMLRQ